ncbi:DMT family transporter [Tabrizicola sp.]|uniref:DMT family transporter n=1 Tax=Tabrizicola sp. TaxID=2005166 RepID=UPI003F3852C3
MSPTLDPQLRNGVATILVTVFAMALADAVVKLSSAAMPLWQLWLLRSALVVPVLLAMARTALLPQRLGWIILRSVLLALMYLGIYAAIPVLDLSVIAAALYTGPLFIVAFSALILREPIGFAHWMAILGGFAGVLLIVRPLAAEFTLTTLWPLAAAVCYALAAVLTRAKCQAVSATAMALWLNLALLVIGAASGILIAAVAGPGEDFGNPFLLGLWQPMTAMLWGVVVMLSVLMVGIGIGLARAYQSPRPEVIATFDYAYLPFAAFWGYVFFGEVPDIWTAAGMTAILGAGLAVLALPGRGGSDAGG